MGNIDLSVNCALLEQSILNRYPLILVECEEQIDFNLVRLRFKPDSTVKTVRITLQDYLDGEWESKVEAAIRELYLL
jgi:hypothetical protein